jgi:hypothetical protein
LNQLEKLRMEVSEANSQPRIRLRLARSVSLMRVRPMLASPLMDDGALIALRQFASPDLV